MKISVITPTNNSAKTIDRCIKSIINQTVSDFEHIIIDNLSSDKTLEIVKNLYKNILSNLSIISEKDSGIADAFNKGINASTGRIITILNSDDYYYSENIFEIVINSFQNTKYLIAHGDVLFVDPKYGTYLRTPYSLNKLTTMPLNHPTMFIKREVYNSIGLFDTTYRYSMDFEFYCRLYNNYPDLSNMSFYFNKNPMVVMSAGGESWSNEIQSILEVKRAVKKHRLINVKLLVQIELRLFRTYLKSFFNKIGLNFLVRLWRKINY